MNGSERLNQILQLFPWTLCHHVMLLSTFRADSITWNPHKLMGVPLQCSAFITKHTVMLYVTHVFYWLHTVAVLIHTGIAEGMQQHACHILVSTGQETIWRVVWHRRQGHTMWPTQRCSQTVADMESTSKMTFTVEPCNLWLLFLLCRVTAATSSVLIRHLTMQSWYKTI